MSNYFINFLKTQYQLERYFNKTNNAIVVNHNAQMSIEMVDVQNVSKTCVILINHKSLKLTLCTKHSLI